MTVVINKNTIIPEAIINWTTKATGWHWISCGVSNLRAKHNYHETLNTS